MVKFILIKSPEWATTKQACIGMNVHVVYLFFSSMHIIYSALLLCIEHYFTEIKFYTWYSEQLVNSFRMPCKHSYNKSK